MAFDIGSVIAKVDADISGFKKGMGEAQGIASGFGSKLQAIGGSIASFGKQAAIFTGVVGAGLVVFGKQSVDAFNESEAAMAQLQAVIKSTGGVAGVTAKEATNLASSLQKITPYSDEAVLSAENLLLTFTNIKDDIFPEATKTVLNMSTALGQDLKSSSIQLGKALQDPVLGVTALRRVGVNFNEEQQNVIKNLVETGRAAEAQQLILKELATEFGGSATAAAETFAGRMEILKNQFNDFQENIGHAITALGIFAVTGEKSELLDALTNLVGTDTAEKLLSFFTRIRVVLVQFSEWVLANQELVITFLQGLAIAIGALMVIGTITMLITALLNPLTLVAIAITALYMAWQTNFWGIRDTTMIVINELTRFFNTFLMPIITAVTNWVRAHWTEIKLVTEGTFNIIKGIIQVVWAAIYAIFSVFLALITGDWKQAWENIKHAAIIAWDGIKNIFNGAIQFIMGWGGNLIRELVRPFQEAWNRISDFVNKIKDALDFTKRHSPSVLDVVRSGVSKVNDALADLSINGSLNANAAGLAVSRGGDQANTNIIQISLAGAFIADTYGANQMAEIMGDALVKRLQAQIRI